MKKLISIIISATILIAMFSLGTIAFAGEHATMGTAKEYVVGETIKGYVNSFKIAGNFTFNIFNELKYTHNDTIDEIASSIILNIKDNISIDDSVSDFNDFE